MKKVLIGLMLIVPLSMFASEMITNGGFNSGVTSWSPTIAHGGGRATPCYTKYYSSPASCEVYAYGYKPSCQFSSITMSQTIKPVISCTCKIQYQYSCDAPAMSVNKISIILLINKKNDTVWTRGDYLYGMGENLVWTQWQGIYTDKDTITGIIFGADIQSPGTSSYTDSVAFWIDDVSITGTPVVGIEEQGSLKPSLQAVDLKIIKGKIYLSAPKSINAELKIYDLCGRTKEVIYSGTLSKGDYTFTPNIKKSGVYFVKLSAGNIKETKKLILMK
ncbi:MAG: T9SS type A sorting domain-containing protein [bacterium]|nr:T9SS type A sorting domain-containing protein [bacterium]